MIKRLSVIICALFLCQDRKSTRLNSSHSQISYAVFCLKKKTSLVTETDHELPFTGHHLTASLLQRTRPLGQHLHTLSHPSLRTQPDSNPLHHAHSLPES